MGECYYGGHCTESQCADMGVLSRDLDAAVALLREAQAELSRNFADVPALDAFLADYDSRKGGG